MSKNLHFCVKFKAPEALAIKKSILKTKKSTAQDS
jgi:hypothetical protein